MANKKEINKRVQYAKEILEKDPTLNYHDITRMMCLEFDLEYTDAKRTTFSRILTKRGIESGWSGHKAKDKMDTSPEFQKAKKKKYDKRRKTFIFTWAQNATPVHEGLFKNIEVYSKSLNAGLHVIAGRYKNPTSVFTNNQKNDEYWAEEVQPYLDANRHNIHEFLQVLADVKISPTASTPLSGLNGVTGLESCIVGHPRQHLKSLPVLENYPHKLLLSTGACTKPNYTDSKAGKKGEFHHMLGFIIVELDGTDFHIRQVNADNDGNFYDIHKRVKNGKVYENTKGCEAAILGDIHTRHNNKEVTKVTFKLLDKLKPKHTIIHDIAEMESILHWDLKDPFKLLMKEETGLNCLAQEIDEIMEWIEDHISYNLVMARSNHDDMLDRWLKNTDWRKSENKAIYLKLAGILATEEDAQVKGVLPFLIDQKFGKKITTLSLDDSFRVFGWELAMHGHLGANGSRGGHTQFKNLNTKNVTGHGHHPHREDGHVMVGTLSHLRVGFNRGPSNWMNGFGLIYPDGKLQLIHITNNKYCR